ncbi:MAG TPA: prepilin-type N-terminal cleavage/methylation domain-containing protein [Candidatus Ozemobacteraceae bacterium]|nr:prepilin-type N-terminal cleavage/methylation domain-containing protein [Candidatus Ozemobacteraceae bacterium]
MLRKGFTLIELLVVITILAVLAGAALPYVQSYVEESKIAKAKTDLEEIARALAVYETREGEYLKATVEDLTGRYLNKAPIDPWGKSYVVATDSGTVFSSGPDRTASTKEDNVVVPYQPPLALVQVKWVDKNQTGAVDIKNTPDQVQLIFSRRIQNSISDIATNFTTYFSTSSGAANLMLDPTAGNMVSLASKTIVMNVVADNRFTPGSDTLNIATTHNLKDMAGNAALPDQKVRILPQ